MIDDNLIKAYRTAKYIVEYNNQTLRIRVGKKAVFLEPLLAQHQVKSAFFITPENPFSCALTQQENTLRHTRFIKALNQKGYVYLTGYGTDEAESWQKESSYLIFTNNENAMHKMASNYGQNAFLKISVNLPVQLLVLQPPTYMPS